MSKSCHANLYRFPWVNNYITIVVDFWNDTHDPDEFHVAKLCILPKKGDLRLTKNYRGICLLDVAAEQYQFTLTSIG